MTLTHNKALGLTHNKELGLKWLGAVMSPNAHVWVGYLWPVAAA